MNRYYYIDTAVTMPDRTDVGGAVLIPCRSAPTPR